MAATTKNSIDLLGRVGLIILLVVATLIVAPKSSTPELFVSETFEQPSYKKSPSQGNGTEYFEPEWPQHGNVPERTFYQTGTAPDSNHILWNKNYMAILHPPIIVNNKVISHGSHAGKFEEANGFLFALDADTGEEVWRTPTTPSSYSGWPEENLTMANADNHGRLYSGWPEGNLIMAIDDARFMYISPGFFHIYEIETGKLIMDFPAGNYLGFGGVFVPELMSWIGVGSYTDIGGQTVEAWDFSDRNGPPILSWRSDPVELIDTRSFYENGRYHIGSNDYTEYCYDAMTGEQLWSRDLLGSTVYYGCAGYGKIFRSSIGNYVWAFDPVTGKILWEFSPRAKGWFAAGIALAQGKLYVLNADRHLYALDAETGELIWKYMCPIEGSQMWHPQYPVVADGKVYMLVSDRPTRPPIVGVSVFVCLDAKTGEEVWTVKDFAEMRCPAIAYGRLYGQDWIYDRGLFIDDWKIKNETGANIWCFGKGPTTLKVGTDTQDIYGLEYITQGGKTSIIGNLSDVSPSHLGAPAPNVPVHLSWRLPDGTEGTITETKTDDSGKIFYKWKPPTAGLYTIIASSTGNNAYAAPEKTVTILRVVKAPPN